MSKRKLEIQQRLFGFPDEDLKTPLHDEIVLWLKKNAIDIATSVVGWTKEWKPDLLESRAADLQKTIHERIALLIDAISLDEKKLAGLAGKTLEYWNRDLPQHLAAKKKELEYLQSWSGLDEPSPPQIEVTTQMECPIRRPRYNEFDIIGYADIVYTVRTSLIKIERFPTLDSYPHGPKLGVDAAYYTQWKTSWTDPTMIAFDAKSTIPSLGELIRQLQTYRAFCKMGFYVVSSDARFAADIADEGFGFVKYPEGSITHPVMKQGPQVR